MKAPDKLFLHDNKIARPSWHHGRVAEGDVEYIRKDVLAERINKQILFYQNSVSANDYEEGCNKGAIAALEHVVKSL